MPRYIRYLKSVKKRYVRCYPCRGTRRTFCLVVAVTSVVVDDTRRRGRGAAHIAITLDSAGAAGVLSTGT